MISQFNWKNFSENEKVLCCIPSGQNGFNVGNILLLTGNDRAVKLKTWFEKEPIFVSENLLRVVYGGPSSANRVLPEKVQNKLGLVRKALGKNLYILVPEKSPNFVSPEEIEKSIISEDDTLEKGAMAFTFQRPMELVNFSNGGEERLIVPPGKYLIEKRKNYKNISCFFLKGTYIGQIEPILNQWQEEGLEDFQIKVESY